MHFQSRSNLLRSLHVFHSQLAPRIWLKIPRKQNKSHLSYSNLAQIPSKRKREHLAHSDLAQIPRLKKRSNKKQTHLAHFDLG